MNRSYEQLLSQNSIMLIQSKRTKIALKLPWVICSVGTAITKGDEPQLDETYNFSLGCSFYKFHGKKLALVDANPIIDILSEFIESEGLRETEYVSIGEPMLLQTYIYVAKSQEFVQSDPTYLHKSGLLLFEIDHHALVYAELQKASPTPNQYEYFSINSEYGLASDHHFFNCLQRGRKDIGCYEKRGKQMHAVVSAYVYDWISRLYPACRL